MRFEPFENGGPVGLDTGDQCVPSAFEEMARRVEALERRLGDGGELKGELDSSPRWWHQWLSVAGITAIIGASVPATSAVNGCASTRKALLESEHQIAKDHLEAALQKSVTDEDHLRHVRFLRKLKRFRSGAFWDTFVDPSAGITDNLADWADDEYRQYFEHLNLRVEDLVERHNRLLAQEARLERLLLVDEGWLGQEEPKWTLGKEARKNPERVRKLLEARESVQQIIGERETELEDIQVERLALEDRWSEIRVVYDLDPDREPPRTPAPDARTMLQAACSASTPDLEACVELGEQHWARALHQWHVADYSLTQAVALFRKACEGDDYYGCALYGRALEKGMGAERDLEKAVKLLDNGCVHNSAPACNSLGWRYLKEEVPPPAGKDAEGAASESFTKSCSLGYMNGCDSVGTLFQRQGELEAAEAKFRYACKRQEIRACINLASILAGKEPDSFSRP